MSFEKQVSQFRRRALDNIDQVYRGAIREMMEQATREQPSVKKTGGSFEVGKVPVDSGRLAESLYLKINGNFRMGVRDTFRRELDKVTAKDKVSFGWNAPYAVKMEYGDGRVQGRFFATSAVRRWQTFVRRAAKKFGG